MCVGKCRHGLAEGRRICFLRWVLYSPKRQLKGVHYLVSAQGKMWLQDRGCFPLWALVCEVYGMVIPLGFWPWFSDIALGLCFQCPRTTLMCRSEVISGWELSGRSSASIMFADVPSKNHCLEHAVCPSHSHVLAPCECSWGGGETLAVLVQFCARCLGPPADKECQPAAWAPCLVWISAGLFPLSHVWRAEKPFQLLSKALVQSLGGERGTFRCTAAVAAFPADCRREVTVIAAYKQTGLFIFHGIFEDVPQPSSRSACPGLPTALSLLPLSRRNPVPCRAVQKQICPWPLNFSLISDTE